MALQRSSRLDCCGVPTFFDFSEAGVFPYAGGGYQSTSRGVTCSRCRIRTDMSTAAPGSKDRLVDLWRGRVPIEVRKRVPPSFAAWARQHTPKGRARDGCHHRGASFGTRRLGGLAQKRVAIFRFDSVWLSLRSRRPVVHRHGDRRAHRRWKRSKGLRLQRASPVRDAGRIPLCNPSVASRRRGRCHHLVGEGTPVHHELDSDYITSTSDRRVQGCRAADRRPALGDNDLCLQQPERSEARRTSTLRHRRFRWRRSATSCTRSNSGSR